MAHIQLSGVELNESKNYSKNYLISLYPFLRIVLWLSLTNYVFSSKGSDGCPSVCLCIWKSGKQTVECENQNLSSLPDGIYSETQVLNISGNRLSILPRDAFLQVGLPNLQRIYVRNSRIRQIEPFAFNELINLVELDLSDNLLTSVPTNAFKSTPYLRELNLAGNALVRISSGAFQFIGQLVKLDLSRAQLVQIEDLAFSHFRLLETLKISSNQLTTLTNTTVKSFSQLHGLELHDNPWNCDCRLRELRVWSESRKNPFPISPACHSPQRLAGKRFSEIGSSEFACPPVISQHLSERVVTAREGENATLVCSVDSLPITSIHWYSQRRLITNNMGISAHRKFLVTIDEESGKSNLILTNALQKDSGEFLCVVENSAGFSEANFTLGIVPAEPTFNFPVLDLSHILIICVGLLGILLVLSIGVLILFWRRRALKPPEPNATPNKPPRLNYDLNPPPQSFVANGYHAKSKVDSTDNPDLIMETNNSGSYQETGLEEQSSSSELNWEQQSYRNLSYGTEYPPDYGLPIIPEHSVYGNSEGGASWNGNNNGLISPSNHTTLSVMSAGSGGGGGGCGSSNGNTMVGHGGSTVGAVMMSGVWSKNNKVGTRIIRAPSARDSPDEGYQEGYCGTDV